MELAELLTAATANYAEHGQSHVYLVVHECDSAGAVIDHNVRPQGIRWNIWNPLQWFDSKSKSYFVCLRSNDEVAASNWLLLADKIGAWLLQSDGSGLMPLPAARQLCATQMFVDLKDGPCGQRLGTLWYCNAFAGALELLRSKSAMIQSPPATGKAGDDAGPDAEERALAALAKYPDLTTITAIAEKAECTREHLSRNCPRFKAAFLALKKTRQPSRIVRGSKSKDGNLEAWSNDEIDDD